MEKLTEDIRFHVEDFVFYKAGNVTASFGITLFDHRDSLETIVSRADEALYKAKEQGRNRVIFKK